MATVYLVTAGSGDTYRIERVFLDRDEAYGFAEAYNWLVGRHPVVSLGEPISLVAVEKYPLDAIGVAAARGDHVHRRHRRLLRRLVGCTSVSHRPRGHVLKTRWLP